jgi:hypothetical protein
MDEKYVGFNETYSLRVVKDGADYHIQESPTLPVWLALGTQLAQFRQSLIDASKQFGQDVILELRVRDSKPADVSKKAE